MWVVPGSTASPSRSARSTSARSRPTIPASSRSTARRVHSRRSVATWSLRERPVWSLPPTLPTRSVSSVSRFMWTSSRAGSQAIAPASTSSRSPTSPRSRTATSSSVSSPARPSPRTCAIEPAMSSSASTASISIERVNSAIRASGPSPNRPPHNRMEASVPGRGPSYRVSPAGSARTRVVRGCGGTPGRGPISARPTAPRRAAARPPPRPSGPAAARRAARTRP